MLELMNDVKDFILDYERFGKLLVERKISKEIRLMNEYKI